MLSITTSANCKFIPITVEVKNTIYYESLLALPIVFNTPSRTPANDSALPLVCHAPGLLQTCCQNRPEALPMFFDANIFSNRTDRKGEYADIKCMPPNHIPPARLSQHIHLATSPHSVFHFIRTSPSSCFHHHTSPDVMAVASDGGILDSPLMRSCC